MFVVFPISRVCICVCVDTCDFVVMRRPVADFSVTDVAPRIQNRLNQGDRILVQVSKDAMSSKGARLTTDLAIPSRFLVYMPYNPRIRVSARIENEAEKDLFIQPL